MVPDMPSLIPANGAINLQAPQHPTQHHPQHPSQYPHHHHPRHLPQHPPQHLPQHHPQPPSKHPTLHTSPSDDQLHQSLDDQIQIVKKIQKILGTEQMKLELMMKDFNTRNVDMEKHFRANMNKPSEHPSPQQEYIRIRSPSTINDKLSVESNVITDAMENDKDINPVEKPAARTYCVVRMQEPSTREEKEELQRFRAFWSSCDDSLKDDEDRDTSEELDFINIEQLVAEEMKTKLL